MTEVVCLNRKESETQLNAERCSPSSAYISRPTVGLTQQVIYEAAACSTATELSAKFFDSRTSTMRWLEVNALRSKRTTYVAHDSTSTTPAITLLYKSY